MNSARNIIDNLFVLSDDERELRFGYKDAGDVLRKYTVENIVNELNNPLDKNKLLFTKYYEISNSISEYNFSVTGRYTTYSDALNDLPNKCDWYASKGIGTIYEVTLYKIGNKGKLKKIRTKIYQKR